MSLRRFEDEDGRLVVDDELRTYIAEQAGVDDPAAAAEVERANRQAGHDNVRMITDVRKTTDWEADCLKERGRILTGEKTHWCGDWDGLPVDETCSEFACCTCFPKS